MANEYSDKKMDQFGSIDEQAVVDMLSQLGRVQAPANFYFGVRSRIASGEPKPSVWSLPFLFKIAAPALLLLMISGFFFLRVSAPSDIEQASVEPVHMMPVAVSPEPQISVPAATLRETEISGPKAPSRGKRITESPKPPRATSVAARVQRNEAPAGSGSYDLGSTASRGLSLPPTAKADKPAFAPDAGKSARLSTSGVFALMGIKGQFGQSEYTVQTVLAGSAAEQAGLKAGDVVEAINGESAASSVTFPHDFAGAALRIRRNGKVLVLNVGQ